jgi:hypothetical protein
MTGDEMPTYPHHLLLSFGGPLGTTESWTCGVRLCGPGAEEMSGAELNTDAAAMVAQANTKVRAYLTSMGQLINGAAYHGFTKLNGIASNGRYTNQATTEIQHTPPFRLQSIAPTPFHLATVVTLDTGVKRGIASRGRYFLPTRAQDVDMDGAVTVAVSQALADTARAFVTALGTWTGVPSGTAWGAAVVSGGSQTGLSAPGSLLWRPVTGVRVGRVQDTQQRRRVALEEKYVVGATA